MWTPARHKAFIVGALRQGFRRYPPKFATLRAAMAGVKKNKKTGRMAMHYTCAKCSKVFPRTGVQVDHIAPVVAKEFIDWNTYIARMFCEADNLQVLCRADHKIKTKKERDGNRKVRTKAK